MADHEDSREEYAASADAYRLREYLHDPSLLVMKAVLANKNLCEEDVLVIANRKNVSPEILEYIAKERRWSNNYPIKLALARNPSSPLTTTLGLARFLRIFDLEEITRNHYIPLVFRHKVAAMIIERLPTMPLGNKKTLAKKAAGPVLLKLLQDRIPEVVRLSLNNPHLIEAHLYKVISRPETVADTILMITEHPLWSTRPLIRFALARNQHTPLPASAHFLRRMKREDLHELYRDPSLPVAVRPLVHRELFARGNDPTVRSQEVVYEISEEEIRQIEAEVREHEPEGERRGWMDIAE